MIDIVPQKAEGRNRSPSTPSFAKKRFWILVHKDFTEESGERFPLTFEKLQNFSRVGPAGPDNQDLTVFFWTDRKDAEAFWRSVSDYLRLAILEFSPREFLAYLKVRSRWFVALSTRVRLTRAFMDFTAEDPWEPVEIQDVIQCIEQDLAGF